MFEEQRHEYLEVLYILRGWTLRAHVAPNLKSLLRSRTFLLSHKDIYLIFLQQSLKEKKEKEEEEEERKKRR